MFPLKRRILIRGATAHQNAGLGVAADYVAVYEPLAAAFAGELSVPYPRYRWTPRPPFRREGQGGIWLRLARENGDRLEFAHLSKILRIGRVEEGDIIATTGNTGSVTTGPHLHVQIFDSRARRLDPEMYGWGTERPLVERVNEALRVAGSVAEPRRSAYWQERVAKGEKTTFDDLIGGIQWRRQQRLAPHENGQ